MATHFFSNRVQHLCWRTWTGLMMPVFLPTTTYITTPLRKSTAIKRPAAIQSATAPFFGVVCKTLSAALSAALVDMTGRETNFPPCSPLPDSSLLPVQGFRKHSTFCYLVLLC